jgi:hypothetical protein
MAQLPWQNKPRTQIIPCTVREYEQARLQYMGSHMLGTFDFSPRLAQWKMKGLIPSKSTSYYEVGKALHCFVLEGATEFHNRYEVAEGPINPKTQAPYGRDTKAFSTWYEEITATGKEIVSGAELNQIEQMAESIYETAARDLLQVGAPEVTIRGHLYQVACQSRLDWLDYSQNIIHLVDLKTTENLGRFEKDFWKFGYQRQLAFYRGMVDGLGMGRPIQVDVIAVEKQEPYRSHVWNISEATLLEAEEWVKARLLDYRQLVANFGFDRPWPLSLEFGRSIGTL